MLIKYVYINCNCAVSGAAARHAVGVCNSQTTINIMTDRIVFSGRKFYAMYLKSQFMCHKINPLKTKRIRFI
jgi:hypothetical protein